MQSTDDSVLLREYAENHSDEAFAALVAKYINLVFSIAMRSIGNSSGAEEITQAVFIIFAKKAGQLRNDKALSSWLFKTTQLTSNNFLRSEMRRQHREQEAYDMQTILSEPEPELWPKIAPLLDNAVAALKEKDRRAILLRFYEGKNLQEIGTALGASEVAVEKRVSRTIEKLQKFFFKRGVTSTAKAITAAISVNSIQAAPVGLAKTISAIAIAKGAAASGSTLTLIKGALKIMAWTKAKTAVMAGVVIILAAGTTTTLIVSHQHRTEVPIPQNSWAFKGYVTPAATFQSALSAMSKGDVKSLAASYTSDFENQFMETAGKGKSDNELAVMFTQIAGMISDFQVASNEVVSTDEVILHFHSSRMGDALIPMKKIGGEWKINGNITADQTNIPVQR